MDKERKARFEAYVQLAKNHKKMWVELTQRGDMNPTVIGIREGRAELLCIAPQLDKHEGLKAINLLRKAMGIDEVILMVDAHTMLTKGKTQEEIDRLYEKYVGKAGAMQQACDEEGACAKREIADCLCIHYLDKDKKFHMGSYPYDYHGKDGGVEFEWMEEHTVEMLDSEVDFDVDDPERVKEMRERLLKQDPNKVPRPEGDPPKRSEGEGKVGGFMPCTIYRIMEQPSMFDDLEIREDFPEPLKEYLSPENRQKALFHTGVVCRKLLDDHGFIVLECLDIKENDTYENFSTQMAEKYIAGLRAYDRKKGDEAKAMKEMLNEAEKKAKADGDQEMLLRIKHLKKQLEDSGNGEQRWPKFEKASAQQE